MPEPDFIEEFNREFRQLYLDYNKAVSENDFDRAITTGKKILGGLVKISKEYILPALRSREVRELFEDILSFHEKNLAFVEGTQEAVRDMPVLFTFEAKERAVEILSSSIVEFFSFVLGALIILADIEACGRSAKKEESEEKDVVPRVL